MNAYRGRPEPVVKGVGRSAALTALLKSKYVPRHLLKVPVPPPHGEAGPARKKRIVAKLDTSSSSSSSSSGGAVNSSGGAANSSGGAVNSPASSVSGGHSPLINRAQPTEAQMLALHTEMVERCLRLESQRE
jgi:hypothetical protein